METQAVQFKFSPRKAQAVVAYLVKAELPVLTAGKICKLAFLADKLHLVQFGRTITGDTYFAFDHGPVPSKTYDLLKSGYFDKNFRYGRYSLRPNIEINFAVLSVSDRGALDEIISRHGRKTFAELRALTHDMPEYRYAWERRKPNEKTAAMAFEEFFEQDEDVIEGALEEALENSAIAHALQD